MKSLFHERSAYGVIGRPAPDCFLRLDDHFDRAHSDLLPSGALIHHAVLLAESICARMADVELYAYLIEDARNRQHSEQDGQDRASILNRSYFVGYLGASRSLLDACASALALLHELPLARPDRTFGSALFWQQLVEKAPNVHRRYHVSRIFFNEVSRWCGETADRIVPIEILNVTFGHYSTRDSHMKVLDDASSDLRAVTQGRRIWNWVDPLQLHDRWNPEFQDLCRKLCTEIQISLPVRE
jgi:hypothetical protein